jgi:branched-chain amino acid transport system permease protein
MARFRIDGKIVSRLVLPVWIGLLALPLTGVIQAALLALIAAAVPFFFRASFSGFVQDVIHRIADITQTFFNRLTSRTRSISSGATLPFVLALLIITPLFLNDYYRDIATLTGIYIVLALGLNLIVGQTGLLNLGYVAFYAIGAYTYAILSTRYGLSFWPGLVAGGISASIFAVLLGYVTLNLRGDYFAIVTLGLGEITRIFFNNWDSVTGGPNGIARIPRPVLAGYELHTTLDFTYLMLAFVLFAIFASKRLVSSRIGRAWVAIREDEIASEACGIDAFKLKLLAFVLGSAVAGCTGVLFAAKMAFVSPESFTFFESVLILCMVVLGGRGSIAGIVLAAALLIALPEAFREFQDYRMLAFGIALVLMMIFRPQGLLGKLQASR